VPAVSRKGDSLTTGHACVVARITNPTVVHLFPPNVPPCGTHASTVKVGSDTVFAVGLAMARIGDSADAGAMTTGSNTVFAGG
jgi:uncharacterized Zn-binding protein involved in type VI secretion